MAVYKKLKTKINGVTTEVYPYTSPEAVLNSDGTTLQDTLDVLSDSVKNAVSDIKVDWNETNASSVNYIHNKPDLDLKANVNSPEFTGLPKAPTAVAGTNTEQIATTAFVQKEIDDLINGASAATDTLKELADLIEDNADLIDTLEGISHEHDNKTVLDNTTASFTTALKDKIDGISDGANSYTHPTYTSASSGLYKITVDTTGHVSNVASVTKSDITALGIPGNDTDTTYSAATSDTLGLVKVGNNITNSSGTISISKQNVIDALGYTPGTSFSEPDGNTTYTLSKSGSTITLTGSDGNTTSVEDSITEIEGDDYVIASQTDSTVSLSHKDIDVANVYRTAVLDPSVIFEALKAIEVDDKGHITKISTVTYTVPKEKIMTGATSSANGTTGYVPAPSSGQEDYFLRGDGAWVEVDTTTASNGQMGQCYATCSSAEGSAAYTFTHNDFAFTEGGIVSVLFTNAVTAGARLQELNYGSKPMYYNGSAITDGIISAGDTATFMYSNGIFHLIAINRVGEGADGNTTYKLTKSGNTITLTGSDGSTTSVTDANTTYSKLSQFTNDSGYITGITKTMVTDALGYTPPTTNTTYSAATSSALGLVKIGSNISNSSGTISITKDNVIAALGYTPGSSVDNNTTYSLSKSGSTITLTGSDGSTTSVTDADTNTTYSKLSQFTNDSGYITGITKTMVTNALGYTPPTSNTTYSQATSSTAGLVKIGYTESGKNYPVELNSSGQMYVNVPWTDTTTSYTHPSYTARTGVPTANQTPAFGGTFTVSQPVSDATGHITAMNSRTITIPSTVATTSASGLMSSTDKTKLDATPTFVVTDIDPGVGGTTSYANGTVILVKEVTS